MIRTERGEAASLEFKVFRIKANCKGVVHPLNLRRTQPRQPLRWLPKALGVFAKLTFMSLCTKECDLRGKFRVYNFQTDHPECVRQHF